MASIYRRRRNGKPTGPYIAAWLDRQRQRQTASTGTTDKAAAKRIANKWEADAALRREAVIDASAELIQIQAVRSIEEHLTDFVARMKSAQRSALHVAHTCRMIRRVAKASTWERAADISADGMNRFASALADRSDRGSSARTIEKHIVALKSFTAWLTRHGKLAANPLATVMAPRPNADRRLVRRMLRPDEWECLKSALTDGSDQFGMLAGDRLALYWLAIETGLRSSELRTLKRGNLHLSDSPPFVTVPAGSTKNRQSAKQYIGDGMANELHRLTAGKLPTVPLFNLPSPNRLAAMIRADLADARAEWLGAARKDADEFAKRSESDFLLAIDHNGERIDLHALRHTCGAWLAKAGERPQVIQAVMRHSTITLTMDTYGHLFPDDRSGAVGKVQTMLGPIPARLAATGTDGKPAADKCSAFAARDVRKAPFQRARKDAERESVATKAKDAPNRLPLDWPELLLGSAMKRMPIASNCKVVRAGIEPATHGFSVHCSTN